MKTMKTPKGTELPIISLKGKDYLQVAHRLVWFREEKPTWAISTEFVKLEETYCIAKAVISDETGKLVSTGHKREDAKHFPDFMEKAETGAIGRALAHMGYGTQFAPEIDEGLERVVDSPLPPKKFTPKAPGGLHKEVADRSPVISENQRKRMIALAIKAGYVTQEGKLDIERLKALASQYGYTGSSTEMPVNYYNQICDHLEKEAKDRSNAR